MESYVRNSRAYLQGLPVASSPTRPFEGSSGGNAPPSSMYPESAPPRVPISHGPAHHGQQQQHPQGSYSADPYPIAHPSRQYDPIPPSRGSAAPSYYYPGQDAMQHAYPSVPKHSSRPPDIKSEGGRGLAVTRSLEVTRVGPAHMFGSIAPAESTQIIVSRPNMAHSVMTSSSHSHSRYGSPSQPHNPSQRPPSHSKGGAPPSGGGSSKVYSQPYQAGTSSKAAAAAAAASQNPPMLIKAEEPTTLFAASQSPSTPSRHNSKNSSRHFETATAPIPYALAKQVDDPFFYKRLENSFAQIKRVENPWAAGKEHHPSQPPEAPPTHKHKPEEELQRRRGDAYTPSPRGPTVRDKLPHTINGVREPVYLERLPEPKRDPSRDPDNERCDSALDLSVKTVRQTADSTAPEPDPIPLNYSDLHGKGSAPGINCLTSLGKAVSHDVQLPTNSATPGSYKDGRLANHYPSSFYPNAHDSASTEIPSSSRISQTVPPTGYGHTASALPHDVNGTGSSSRGFAPHPLKRPIDPYHSAGSSSKMPKMDSSKRRSPYPSSKEPNPLPNQDPTRGFAQHEAFLKNPNFLKQWASACERQKLVAECYVTKQENPAMHEQDYIERKSSAVSSSRTSSSSHAKGQGGSYAQSYYSSPIPLASSHYQGSSKKAAPPLLPPTSEHAKSYHNYYYPSSSYSPVTKHSNPKPLAHDGSLKGGSVPGLYNPDSKESHRFDAEPSHYLKPSVSVSLVSSESSKHVKTGSRDESYQDFSQGHYSSESNSFSQSRRAMYSQYGNPSHSSISRSFDLTRTPFEEFSEKINEKFEIMEYNGYPDSNFRGSAEIGNYAQPVPKASKTYSASMELTTQARNPFEDIHDTLLYSSRSAPYPSPSALVHPKVPPDPSHQEALRGRNVPLIKANSPEPFHCDEMPSLIKVTEIDTELKPDALNSSTPHNDVSAMKEASSSRDRRDVDEKVSSAADRPLPSIPDEKGSVHPEEHCADSTSVLEADTSRTTTQEKPKAVLDAATKTNSPSSNRVEGVCEGTSKCFNGDVIKCLSRNHGGIDKSSTVIASQDRKEQLDDPPQAASPNSQDLMGGAKPNAIVSEDTSANLKLEVVDEKPVETKDESQKLTPDLSKVAKEVNSASTDVPKDGVQNSQSEAAPDPSCLKEEIPDSPKCGKPCEGSPKDYSCLNLLAKEEKPPLEVAKVTFPTHQSPSKDTFSKEESKIGTNEVCEAKLDSSIELKTKEDSLSVSTSDVVKEALDPHPNEESREPCKGERPAKESGETTTKSLEQKVEEQEPESVQLVSATKDEVQEGGRTELKQETKESTPLGNSEDKLQIDQARRVVILDNEDKPTTFKTQGEADDQKSSKSSLETKDLTLKSHFKENDPLDTKETLDVKEEVIDDMRRKVKLELKSAASGGKEELSNLAFKAPSKQSPSLPIREPKDADSLKDATVVLDANDTNKGMALSKSEPKSLDTNQVAESLKEVSSMAKKESSINFREGDTKIEPVARSANARDVAKDCETAPAELPKDLSLIPKSSVAQANADSMKAISLVCKPEVGKVTLRTDLLEPDKKLDLSTGKTIAAAFREASRQISPSLPLQKPLHPDDSLIAQSPWKSVMPFSIPPDYCPPNPALGKGSSKKVSSQSSALQPLASSYKYPSIPSTTSGIHSDKHVSQAPYNCRPAASHSVPPHSVPSLMPPPSSSAPPQSGVVPSKNPPPRMHSPSPFQPRSSSNLPSHPSRSPTLGGGVQPNYPAAPTSRAHSLHPSIVKPESHSSRSAQHSAPKTTWAQSSVSTCQPSSFSYSASYFHYTPHPDAVHGYPHSVPNESVSNQRVQPPSSPSSSKQAFEPYPVRSPHSPLHPPPVDNTYSYQKSQIPYPHSPTYPPSSHTYSLPHTTNTTITPIPSVIQRSAGFDPPEPHTKKPTVDQHSYLQSKEAHHQGYQAAPKNPAPYPYGQASSDFLKGSSSAPYDSHHPKYPYHDELGHPSGSSHSNHPQTLSSQGYPQEYFPTESRDPNLRPTLLQHPAEQQKKSTPRSQSAQHQPPPSVSYAGPYATSNYIKYSNSGNESTSQRPGGEYRSWSSPHTQVHPQAGSHPPQGASSHHSYPTPPPSHPQQASPTVSPAYPPLAHSQKPGSTPSSVPYQKQPPKAAHSQNYQASQVCQAPPTSYPRSTPPALISGSPSPYGGQTSQHKDYPSKASDHPYYYPQVSDRGHSNTRGPAFSPTQGFSGAVPVPSRTPSTSPRGSRSKTPQSSHTSPSPSRNASPHPSRQTPTPNREHGHNFGSQNDPQLAHLHSYSSKHPNPPLNLTSQPRRVNEQLPHGYKSAEGKGSLPLTQMNPSYTYMPQSHSSSSPHSVVQSPPSISQSRGYPQTAQSPSVPKQPTHPYPSSHFPPTSNGSSQPKDGLYSSYPHHPHRYPQEGYPSSATSYQPSDPNYNGYPSAAHSSKGYPGSSSSSKQQGANPYLPSSTMQPYPPGASSHYPYQHPPSSDSSVQGGMHPSGQLYTQTPKAQPPPKAHSSSLYPPSQSYPSYPPPTTSIHGYSHNSYSCSSTTYPTMTYSYSAPTYQSSHIYSNTQGYLPPSTAASYPPSTHSYTHPSQSGPGASGSFSNSQPYPPPKGHSGRPVPYKQDYPPLLEKLHPNGSASSKLPCTPHYDEDQHSTQTPESKLYSALPHSGHSKTAYAPVDPSISQVSHQQQQQLLQTEMPTSSLQHSAYSAKLNLPNNAYRESPYRDAPHKSTAGEKEKSKDVRGSSRPLPFPSKHPGLLAAKAAGERRESHPQAPSSFSPSANIPKSLATASLSSSVEGGSTCPSAPCESSLKLKTLQHSSGSLASVGEPGKMALAGKLALRKLVKDEPLKKKGSEEGESSPKAKSDEFDFKFDSFLEDLASNAESLTSKKSCYLGKRYSQKMQQLQQAVDNNEIYIPDPVVEESEDSEPETPVKFRGKFKSIKDKAVERVILTYASHSDESAIEFIPDEDASDFEEELIREIKAKSKRGKKGKSSKFHDVSGTTHSKCPLKLKTQRLKPFIKEERSKKLESDFTVSSSNSDSSSSYSISRSSSDSSGSSSDSGESAASDSGSSSEAKSPRNKKKISKLRKIETEDSSNSDEDFIPTRTRTQASKVRDSRRKADKRRTKQVLSSDSDEVKQSSRKKMKKKLKGSSSSSRKRKGSPDDSQSEDLPKTRNSKNKSLKKFNHRKQISSSDTEDDETLKKKVTKKILTRPLSPDSGDEANAKAKIRKQVLQNPSEDNDLQSEAKEEEPKPPTKTKEEDQPMVVEYSSLIDKDDPVVQKILKQREEECHREDVHEMTAWRDEVSQEMLKLLADLPESRWRQSWRKPQFGDEFHRGWQQELKQYKIESIRTPKSLVSIPPVPASILNEKASKKSKDGKRSQALGRSSPSPAKNTRSKSGIVKTSLNVSGKSNCKVASRPEISSMMQRFFEKVMGAPLELSEGKNSLVKKLPPNPFSQYGPQRVPTGLTPTPSVAPSMLASDNSDRDSLASLRTDLPASDSVPVARKHSFVNSLIKKLNKYSKGSKVNTQWLNKPRSILESTNKPQLLPTPGLTMYKSATSASYNSLTPSATLFREHSVNKYRDTFDEVISKNGGTNHELAPTLAPSRTRTKSRAMMDAATIRAVFGGEPPPKEGALDKGNKLKKKPLVKLEEIVIPAPSPIPSSLSQSSGTPVDFLFQNAEEEYDSELRSERSSSVLGESALSQGVQASRKKFRRYRKSRSGFDYIPRKKKKARQEEDIVTASKKKMPTRRRVLWPEATDVATEVRTWVTNKGLGETILHKAARLRYHDVVIHCLESNDFDVNIRDNAGYTPLHEACNRGHLDIAQALCAHRAFLNAPGYGGKRPLHEAIENGFPELARLLLAYGADPSLSTYAGQSCLSLATESTCRIFLKDYLSDLKGEKADVCIIPGPSGIFDLLEQGSDFFCRLQQRTAGELGSKGGTTPSHDDLKSHADQEPELVFESSEKLVPNTYQIVDRPDRYLLQSDLLEYLDFTPDQLVKEAGTIETLYLNPEEFERSVRCCTFGYKTSVVLSPGETEVTLVKYTSKVRKMLQVQIDFLC